MADEMIIDPSGMTARADNGTIPSSSSTPNVPAAATEIEQAATMRAPGTRFERDPDVSVAVVTITARITTVRPPWSPNTKSST